MAQIPTPPASRDASEAPEASPKLAGPSSDLLQSLDLLLERYLKLLDHYQALQMRLEKQLSSVCLFPPRQSPLSRVLQSQIAPLKMQSEQRTDCVGPNLSGLLLPCASKLLVLPRSTVWRTLLR